ERLHRAWIGDRIAWAGSWQRGEQIEQRARRRLREYGIVAQPGGFRSLLDLRPIAKPRAHVGLLDPDVVMPDGSDKRPDERCPIECGGSVDGEHAGHRGSGFGSKR